MQTDVQAKPAPYRPHDVMGEVVLITGRFGCWTYAARGGGGSRRSGQTELVQCTDQRHALMSCISLSCVSQALRLVLAPPLPGASRSLELSW
jgi:hypothetical protein